MNKQLTIKTIAAAAAATAAIGLAVTGGTSSAASEPNLRERLLQPSELPAFATVLCPSVVDDAYRWAGRYASTDSLQRNGFVAGLSEPLYSRGLRAQAVASVAQFRTDSGARAEAEREVATARRSPGRFSTFTVSSVTSAYGFTLRRGAAIERDVVFNAGRYVYLAGVTYRLGSTPVPKNQLVAAAAALYERVR
jgi:hypothetical protein